MYHCTITNQAMSLLQLVYVHMSLDRKCFAVSQPAEVRDDTSEES